MLRHMFFCLGLGLLWACDGPTPPPTPQPPTVSILSPAAGSQHNEGASLRLEARCTDWRSNQLTCQWWDGATQLPSGNVANVVLNGSGNREYRVTAASDGLSSEAKVAVTVNSGPVVNKCGQDWPRPDFTYSYGRPFYVCAWASDDPDGRSGPITWETSGQVLLSYDTGTVVMPAGTTELRACARDGKGAKNCRQVPLKISGIQKFLSIAQGGPGWVFAQSDLEGLKPEMVLDVTASGDWPSYSADGSRILYAANASVAGPSRHSFWFAAYDGRWKREVAVTSCGSELDGIASSDLSPDGQWIVFTGLVRDVGNDLYLMKSDGTNCRRLTAITCNTQSPPCRSHSNSPVFDKTGRYIFALRNSRNAQDQAVVEVVKLDLQVNTEQALPQLPTGKGGSPMGVNSTLLAFDQPFLPGGAQFGVVNLDGSNARMLGNGFFPSFCTDSTLLVQKSALVSEVVRISDGGMVRQLNYNGTGYASVGYPRCQPKL